MLSKQKKISDSQISLNEEFGPVVAALPEVEVQMPPQVNTFPHQEINFASSDNSETRTAKLIRINEQLVDPQFYSVVLSIFQPLFDSNIIENFKDDISICIEHGLFKLTQVLLDLIDKNIASGFLGEREKFFKFCEKKYITCIEKQQYEIAEIFAKKIEHIADIADFYALLSIEFSTATLLCKQNNPIFRKMAAKTTLSGCSILHVASKMQRTPLIILLVENGADITHTYKNGPVPLAFYLLEFHHKRDNDKDACKKIDRGIVRLLLDNQGKVANSIVDNDKTLLALTLYLGMPRDIIEMLVESGGDLSIPSSKKGFPPLLSTLESPFISPDSIEYLLGRYEVSLTFVCNKENPCPTALLFALDEMILETKKTKPSIERLKRLEQSMIMLINAADLETINIPLVASSNGKTLSVYQTVLKSSYYNLIRPLCERGVNVNDPFTVSFLEERISGISSSKLKDLDEYQDLIETIRWLLIYGFKISSLSQNTRTLLFDKVLTKDDLAFIYAYAGCHRNITYKDLKKIVVKRFENTPHELLAALLEPQESEESQNFFKKATDSFLKGMIQRKKFSTLIMPFMSLPADDTLKFIIEYNSEFTTASPVTARELHELILSYFVNENEVLNKNVLLGLFQLLLILTIKLDPLEENIKDYKEEEELKETDSLDEFVLVNLYRSVFLRNSALFKKTLSSLSVFPDDKISIIFYALINAIKICLRSNYNRKDVIEFTFDCLNQIAIEMANEIPSPIRDAPNHLDEIIEITTNPQVLLLLLKVFFSQEKNNGKQNLDRILQKIASLFSDKTSPDEKIDKLLSLLIEKFGFNDLCQFLMQKSKNEDNFPREFVGRHLLGLATNHSAEFLKLEDAKISHLIQTNKKSALEKLIVNSRHDRPLIMRLISNTPDTVIDSIIQKNTDSQLVREVYESLPATKKNKLTIPATIRLIQFAQVQLPVPTIIDKIKSNTSHITEMELEVLLSREFSIAEQATIILLIFKNLNKFQEIMLKLFSIKSIFIYALQNNILEVINALKDMVEVADFLDDEIGTLLDKKSNENFFSYMFSLSDSKRTQWYLAIRRHEKFSAPAFLIRAINNKCVDLIVALSEEMTDFNSIDAKFRGKFTALLKESDQSDLYRKVILSLRPVQDNAFLETVDFTTADTDTRRVIFYNINADKSWLNYFRERNKELILDLSREFYRKNFELSSHLKGFLKHCGERFIGNFSLTTILQDSQLKEMSTENSWKVVLKATPSDELDENLENLVKIPEALAILMTMLEDEANKDISMELAVFLRKGLLQTCSDKLKIKVYRKLPELDFSDILDLKKNKLLTDNLDIVIRFTPELVPQLLTSRKLTIKNLIDKLTAIFSNPENQELEIPADILRIIYRYPNLGKEKLHPLLLRKIINFATDNLQDRLLEIENCAAGKAPTTYFVQNAQNYLKRVSDSLSLDPNASATVASADEKTVDEDKFELIRKYIFDWNNLLSVLKANTENSEEYCGLELISIESHPSLNMEKAQRFYSQKKKEYFEPIYSLLKLSPDLANSFPYYAYIANGSMVESIALSTSKGGNGFHEKYLRDPNIDTDLQIYDIDEDINSKKVNWDRVVSVSLQSTGVEKYKTLVSRPEEGFCQFAIEDSWGSKNDITICNKLSPLVFSASRSVGCGPNNFGQVYYYPCGDAVELTEKGILKIDPNFELSITPQILSDKQNCNKLKNRWRFVIKKVLYFMAGGLEPDNDLLNIIRSAFSSPTNRNFLNDVLKNYVDNFLLTYSEEVRAELLKTAQRVVVNSNSDEKLFDWLNKFLQNKPVKTKMTLAYDASKDFRPSSAADVNTKGSFQASSKGDRKAR